MYVQIRSHAQKYFLKVQKLGLAAGLPPQHPRRRLLMPQPQSSSPAGSSGVATAILHGQPQQCMPHPNVVAAAHSSVVGWDDCPGVVLPATMGAASFSDETIELPISPDDLHFAQVYRFIGDIFDPNTPCPVEAHLQKLKNMDDVTVKTILLVLRNLEDNLLTPQFEPIRRLLSTYDPKQGLLGQL
ncbi:hypothetical protein GUJ93_ZPchr0001g32740 [Zizania palustris]|uniref:Protein REVEILLE 6 n=1 Tax=Zizania palustris TaxID=103762 RepID=A0A8J5VB04_ZIZPA|nr:hypothetical protein GUJ93_ZPchr0001g32740 [Zizania palustris]